MAMFKVKSSKGSYVVSTPEGDASFKPAAHGGVQAADKSSHNMSAKVYMKAMKAAGKFHAAERRKAKSIKEARRPKSKKAKQAWMRAYSDELVKLDPSKAGKIDWDTAAFFYNSGKDPKEAARKKAKSKKESVDTMLEDLGFIDTLTEAKNSKFSSWLGTSVSETDGVKRLTKVMKDHTKLWKSFDKSFNSWQDSMAKALMMGRKADAQIAQRNVNLNFKHREEVSKDIDELERMIAKAKKAGLK